MVYLLLLIGLVALMKGADFFVEGSSSVARLLKIPPMIIGLTIVSLGTSLPEAAVSITASLSGNNDLSLSNVTGSNIFNILVVVGVCVLIRPLRSDKASLKRDFPVSIGASLLLLLFALNGMIGRIEGLIFLLGCITYIFILVKTALKSRADSTEEVQATRPAWRNVLYIVGGVAAIVIGGDLVVNNAVAIAEMFGISQTIIGLTIVSIGTSLPELVTSVVAARKKESEIALGNALGSCILNILFILGSSALLSPISFGTDGLVPIFVMIAAMLLMYVSALTRKSTGRVEGAIALLLYFGYMAYILFDALT